MVFLENRGQKTCVTVDAWALPATAPRGSTEDVLLDLGWQPKPKPRRTHTSSVACPQPLHPKLAQRRLLPEVVFAASKAMSDDDVKRLAATWDLVPGASNVITIGTACSGSELYTLSLQPLAARLSALTGCTVSFKHVWACELSPRKRDWIRTNFKPDFLFRDLKEVAMGQAWDVADGEGETLRRHVPVPAVDILIAGFSCKDASSLNIHRTTRRDACHTGTGTTGSTFGAFMKLLGGMTPRARLCLLENVPGLAHEDKTSGRSNLDAVKDAFTAQGLFLSKKFDAQDTGIPNRRSRLYMAAVAGLAAMDDQDGFVERIHASLEAMLSQLTPRPITEFLLDAYMPEKYSSDDMMADWVPDMWRRLCRPDGPTNTAGPSKPAPMRADRSTAGGPSKPAPTRAGRSTAGRRSKPAPTRAGRSTAGRPSKPAPSRRLGRTAHRLKRTRRGTEVQKGKKVNNGKTMTWAACPHKKDKARYLADLNGNPWFEVLSDGQKDILLLNLCQHSYPGLQEGVVTVMSSAKFSRIYRGSFPCQVPNAKFWILGHNRLQTGAEGLMLQGVDLVDIPSFGIGAGRRWSDRFLQDLAGNAFCVYQFAVWLLACLPQVPRVAQ